MKGWIQKILVANRGVPAVRIMHTCRDRRIPTTAVYSRPDSLGQHVFMGDSTYCIGEAPPIESYLNMEKLIEAAEKTGCNAVHPGWGFLSENADFAEKVIDAGLIWIGPPPRVIRTLGDKIEAKRLAQQAHLPTIPGISPVETVQEILSWMEDEKVSFPIMIKASAGGGGKGMVKVEQREQLPQALAHARSEAFKSFGDDRILAEKYIERGRHIEVQIMADAFGTVRHLFERECTIQRRNQKIIEEAPSPTLDEDIRQELYLHAVRFMREIGYQSAGTVEFLYDSTAKKFYFLEVNTRLQVEHGITELITGMDLVGLMIDVADGRRLPFKQSEIHSNRWSLEVRLNAEDPKTFSPSFGTIKRLQVPHGPGVRISSGVYEGAEILPYYDSLLMLVMTAGPDRADAIRVMDRCLSRNLRVEGVRTLAPLLLSIIRHPAFRVGEFSTRFIEENLDELIAMFKEKDSEDEVLKIAQYVAEISALGPQPWM